MLRVIDPHGLACYKIRVKVRVRIITLARIRVRDITTGLFEWLG